jgi:hypothetical protein
MLNTTGNIARLSKSAFWDIDLDNLDMDRYADFTIIRVFERGTSEDIKQILAYYGEHRIVESLTNALSLQTRAIALGKKLFGLSQNEFRCYTLQQPVRNYSQY